MNEQLESLLESCLFFLNTFKKKAKTTKISQEQKEYFNKVKKLAAILKTVSTRQSFSQLDIHPTSHGILKKDFSTKIEVGKKKVKINLWEGSDIQIYGEEDSSYIVKTKHSKHGVLEFKIPKELIHVSKNDLSEIQNLPNSDLVFYPLPLEKKLIHINTFISGLSVSTISECNFNLSNIEDGLHAGLKHIGNLLYQEQAQSIILKGGNTLKDKPLDKNSSITGAIDFSSISSDEWSTNYKWTESEITKYSGKKIAFRFTCYEENNSTIVLVEELGIVKDSTSVEKNIDELKEKFNETEFISQKLKHYEPLPKEQAIEVLIVLEKIPTDFQNFIDGIKIGYDNAPGKNGPSEHAIAYVDNREEDDIILAFTPNAFKGTSKDTVAGDKGLDDKNSMLDYVVFHELGHIIEKKIFKKTTKRINNLITIANATKNELYSFYNNNVVGSYLNPQRAILMQPTAFRDFCNTHILPEGNQIPNNSTTDEIKDFIEANYGKFFERPKLKKTIETKIDSILENAQEKKSNVESKGIILPSGTHYLRNGSDWAVQKTPKETAFTIAMDKDGNKLTTYSNVSVSEAFAEAFALFLAQPKTVQDTSPNIYKYFSAKEYEKHNPWFI